MHFGGIRSLCNIGIHGNRDWRMPSVSFVGWPCRSFRGLVENAGKSRGFRVKGKKKKKKGIEAVVGEDEETEEHDVDESEVLSCVMKFGGSSLASAERIREIAQLILSFPEENPIIVLSAMGKTTNNLLLVRNTFFLLFFFLFVVHFLKKRKRKKKR